MQKKNVQNHSESKIKPASRSIPLQKVKLPYHEQDFAFAKNFD
jgi:hypothetical protein